MDPAMYDQLKREIVGVYDRAASLYDQVGIKTATYFGERLIERLNIPAGAQVLDVATGRGALLFPVAERIGPTGRVIGIDLAPTMIAETSSEIEARGLSQAKVQLMDADEVSFAEHSFDYILCGFALHFINYARALEQFRVLLKPGGIMATSHPYVPTDDVENVERWKWLLELTREVFPRGFVPPASWTAPNRLNRPERIGAALTQAGFCDISTWNEETVMYFRDEEEWWSWEWSQASRFWIEGMSAEGLARFKSVSFEKLHAMKGPEGIPIRQGALFAIAKSPTAN